MLQGAEINYSTVQKEALAVVWAIKTLRPYLERTRFVVRSDQASLSWIFKSVSVDNAKLSRFRLKVGEHDFVVKHYPGKQKTWSPTASPEIHRIER